eukprot:SAG31_NODE_1801_length_7238_cov_4.423449_5_plen_656_part_00
MARGTVVAPEILYRHLRDMDTKLLADPPLWMCWRSPTQLQLLLRSRGAVVIDLMPSSSEVANIQTDDNVIGNRDYGEAISAAVGETLGLMVLESGVIAMVQKKPPRDGDEQQGTNSPVPMLLETGNNGLPMIRTGDAAQQVEINPQLDLVLAIGAADLRLYRLSGKALTSFSDRLPLELLGQLPRPTGTTLWQFERVGHEQPQTIMAIAQVPGASVAHVLEFQCRNDLLEPKPSIDIELPTSSTHITSAEWDERRCARLLYGCSDGTVGMIDRPGAGSLATMQKVDSQPITNLGSEVLLVRWHPTGLLAACLLANGDCVFVNICLEKLAVVSECGGCRAPLNFSSQLGYRAEPRLAEWCRADSASDTPAVELAAAADQLAITYDRGPVVIVRMEHGSLGAWSPWRNLTDDAGVTIVAMRMLKRMISGATDVDIKPAVKRAVNFILRLHSAKARADCAALLVGCRFAAVPTAKQLSEPGFIASQQQLLNTFWGDPALRDNPAAADGIKLLELQYRRLGMLALRHKPPLYEEAYACFDILADPDLFAVLASRAIWNNESVTAVMATKKAGLALADVFNVGGAEKTVADATAIEQLEKLQHEGQALSDDQARLYGLWLEANSRHDEAMELYRQHAAFLPTERLRDALACLRDPTRKPI